MNPRILIVDDSLTVRKDLEEAFEEAGIESTLCSNLSEARQALKQTQISLAVLDVRLPDGDGIDLLRDIRANPDSVSLPVLLLSTEAEVGDRVRGIVGGANGYIGKPYDRERLVDRARELLRQRSLLVRGIAKNAVPLVLVIDDSLTFRELLRSALETVGYAVCVAETGIEGLRLAAKIRPDAVVVDGQLPGIDGIAVLRRLRSDIALRHIPCLLLTASTQKEYELEALESGADSFVCKNDGINAVLSRVTAILRSSATPTLLESNIGLVGPTRLLAVDSDRDFVKSLTDELRDEDFEVIAANSGDEALRILSAESVECILLELAMPDTTGLELCRRIRSTAKLKDLPILIFSASNDQESVLQCLAIGADDYVQKSAGSEVLKGRIRAQLRRRQYESENRLIREVIETVRKSEARFRSAFENTNVAMFLTDADSRFVRVNEALAELFGYTADEMLGRSLIELTHTEEVEEIKRRRDELLAGKSNHFEMEMRCLKKDRTLFWSLTNVSLVRSSDSEPLQYVGQMQDISERKRAEEENRRYNERLKILHQIDRALLAGELPTDIAVGVLPLLRDLLEGRRVAVILFDLEKGEAEWLAGAGPNRVRSGAGVRVPINFMGDVDGLKRGEIQRIDVESLPLGSERDSLVASGIEQYVVVPMTVDRELIGGLGFGGPAAPLHPEQIKIAQEVATQFAVAVAQSRMKQRVLEQTNELLNANRDLRQKNQENEMFVYSVSHDLRSPLVNLQGFSKELSLVADDISKTISDASVPDAIRERTSSLIQADMRESIRFIQSAVMRLSSTIDALLHLSRVGRIEYQCREINMQVLIKRLVEAMAATTHEKGAVIRVGNLNPCHGDETAIEQLFSNLLENALKYLDPKRAGLIEVGEIPGDSSYQTYFVRDNGLGINPDYREKVFQAFKRFHVKAAPGEGMGLAIVRRIVERHSGEVRIESQEGVGSTFLVKLPTYRPGGSSVLKVEETTEVDS